MTNAIGNTSAVTVSTGAAPKAANPLNDPLTSQSTFLKLLVEQLKNQDPSKPQDGAQFVAQLAQFSGLEQQLQMRQDLDAIKQSLAMAAPPTETALTRP